MTRLKTFYSTNEYTRIEEVLCSSISRNENILFQLEASKDLDRKTLHTKTYDPLLQKSCEALSEFLETERAHLYRIQFLKGLLEEKDKHESTL